jgi:predicted HTH transcriptional regulator
VACPDGAWVVLRRGQEWLDRRFLAWPYARERQPDVEIEIEPATRLEALITGGEGPTTEFKEELPANDADSKRNVMKTVAAFANGDGGSILFGVTNEGQIVGADSGTRAAPGDTLARLVRSWVSPMPQFTIEAIEFPEITDRAVLVLTVQRGLEPPYAAGTQVTNYVYYVRRGANSFPIAPSEVGALARAGVSATGANPLSVGRRV